MKRSTPEHPKLADLCARLKLRRWEAAGVLELLWHFTAKFAPQGDIGKYPDEAIAKAIDWNRDPTRLVEALVESKWLDKCQCHRLLVHDWHEHADQTVTRILAKKKLAFAQHETSMELAGGTELETKTSQPKAYSHKPEPKPAAGKVSQMPRSSGAPSWDEVNQGWKWYQQEFPGEVNEFIETQLFISVMETPADLAALRENLPLYKQTQKWIDGFHPTSENFLSKRIFRVKPKARDSPAIAQGTKYQQVDYDDQGNVIHG